MTHRILLTALFVALGTATLSLIPSTKSEALVAMALPFAVTSPDIKNGETFTNEFVFSGFGCTGANKAPKLEWGGAPADAKYFAVTMYDPDAPTGSGWWHWSVINIPPSTSALDPAKLPEGAISTRTDYGTTGYGGPCPPVGDKPHRYILTVYALKDKVPLEAEVPAAQVGYYINSLKIGEASLTAYYGR